MLNPDFREMLSCLKDEGVEFDGAWVNKVGVNVDGLDIHVLSREDLIKSKRAAGREKGRGDVAWLEKNTADED